MGPRLTCLCPGCKRTTPAGRLPEWICQRHWSALPRAERRIYARAKRQRRDPKALARIWRRLSRKAIEAAFMDPMI